MVREYRRRCNTVNRVIFVGETEERTACPITKASDNTQFNIFLIFVLYFHSQFQRFFSLFDAFSYLTNVGKRVQGRVTIP